MKTKRIFSILLLYIFVFSITSVLSSCDSNSEEIEHYDGSKLVGMWKSDVIQNEYVTFIFTKEGKVTQTIYQNDRVVDLRSGEYAYDASSNRLIVRDDEGSMTMNIIFQSASKFIMDIDGVSLLFKKQ